MSNLTVGQMRDLKNYTVKRKIPFLSRFTQKLTKMIAIMTKGFFYVVTLGMSALGIYFIIVMMMGADQFFN